MISGHRWILPSRQLTASRREPTGSSKKALTAALGSLLFFCATSHGLAYVALRKHIDPISHPEQNPRTRFVDLCDTADLRQQVYGNLCARHGLQSRQDQRR